MNFSISALTVKDRGNFKTTDKLFNHRDFNDKEILYMLIEKPLTQKNCRTESRTVTYAECHI